MESVADKIPLLTVNAGPREANWSERLREEYCALITYIEINVNDDNEWFNVEPDETGIQWKGKCWYFYENIRYEFDLEFEIPATYPATPIEIVLPELDGKTPKMYRGGKICLDIHFAPLWARHQPSYGVAHALALALGPWLAAEIPVLVDQGIVKRNL
jgi:ufm1-conjugating enzyme 1